MAGKALGPKRLRHREWLADPQVKRWYLNTRRGAQITADVYLGRLGRFCGRFNTTPGKLRAMHPDDVYNLLVDCVTGMEEDGYAGSYVKGMVKALK